MVVFFVCVGLFRGIFYYLIVGTFNNIASDFTFGFGFAIKLDLP